MSESGRITASHRSRAAVIYVRQSTLAQVERNRESTNDRLLLGMKGIMSEAELHVLRARLDGGIRTKAARGELRRGLPVGLIWGEADGEILFHPDEAVTSVIAAVFEQFPLRG
jgi:DNA invertase Pin-like site-specific DNA recombinase